MPLFAVLHLPAFPLEALLRCQPDLRTRPCAVIDPARDADRSRAKAPLLAANHPAAATGIQPGWSATRALARCPTITLLDRDPAAESTARTTLIALARTLAPRLELTHPDTLTLDLSSLPTARHHPADWSNQTLEALAATGLPLRLALAAHPDLARLATRSPLTAASLDFLGPEPTITPPASPQPVQPHHLHPLPLASLADCFPIHPDSLHLLAQLGLATLGHFAHLPHPDLAARSHPHLSLLHSLLQQPTPRPLTTLLETEKFHQSIDFEHPLTSTSQLTFYFKRMLQSIVSDLSAGGWVALGLRVSLGLEGGGVVAREFRLPEPTRRDEWLLRPVAVWLEGLALAAPVVAIELEALPQAPGAAAQDLFERGVGDPHRLADTLARLEALLGPDAVGVPVRADSHRPDCFRVQPLEVGVPMPAVVEPWAGMEPPALPLRRLRPPLAVVVASDPGGPLPRPLALLSGPHRGPILRHRGPFPLSGHWWEPAESWQRAEWDVATDTGHLLRLAFTPPGQWQLEGSYE